MSHLLDVLWLDVDGHGTHNARWRWTCRRLEADRTRVRHPHVQLTQRVRVLRIVHAADVDDDNNACSRHVC